MTTAEVDPCLEHRHDVVQEIDHTPTRGHDHGLGPTLSHLVDEIEGRTLLVLLDEEADVMLPEAEAIPRARAPRSLRRHNGIVVVREATRTAPTAALHLRHDERGTQTRPARRLDGADRARAPADLLVVETARLSAAEDPGRSSDGISADRRPARTRDPSRDQGRRSLLRAAEGLLTARRVAVVRPRAGQGMIRQTVREKGALWR